ncbi:Neural Wiskott-Aldrich syndrome protein [Zootermopsis nevadensis]|uniref:Neural Wiskott-Aldrich syndrome protein n=1 Tax=Zootermopsis nevadensis TaxID=136037 RepID=A0A067R8Y6_ZOONE|nr:Neural Wiskott-Aldrich syndrome protein [Zootermopsis nevadensis]
MYPDFRDSLWVLSYAFDTFWTGSHIQVTGGPPPPPPPPPTSTPPPLVSVSAADSNGHSASGANDPRSALLESIRSGRALKHVDVDGKRSSSASDSRGELLDQIRQGIELKSVQPTPKPSMNSAPEDTLAGALARALAERSRAIHSDTSGSSDDDDNDDEDDEWED